MQTHQHQTHRHSAHRVAQPLAGIAYAVPERRTVRQTFVSYFQHAPGWSMLDASRAMRKIEHGDIARQIVGMAVVEGAPGAKVQCLSFDGRALGEQFHTCTFGKPLSAASIGEDLSELIANNLLLATSRKVELAHKAESSRANC